MLPEGHALVGTRPYRAPHHTISAQALTGGGIWPKPGEISLASRGVLFLDELPEFEKKTLEILRQPLEEHSVTVVRVNGSFTFPAHFMLTAALNPCPCGYYPDRSRCSCTKQQVRRYLGRISRPLLDRIDICVEAAPVTYRDIRINQKNESSAAIRARIEQAVPFSVSAMQAAAFTRTVRWESVKSAVSAALRRKKNASCSRYLPGWD